ncbi:MAG: hypothetical protein ABEI52_01650 [Halobacteriaceae archaeon]
MANVERGVSTVVGYVVNLGVATMLIVGLLTAAGTLVGDQRERAARSELEVIGGRIAADIETADRLLQASDSGFVRVETSLPKRVAGRTYEITIQRSGNEVFIVLEMRNPDVTVTVPVNSKKDISPTSLSGGTLVITGTEEGPITISNEESS